MIPALTKNGYLPHGRHSTTIEEVESQFVPPDNPVRQSMWSDWIALTDLIRETVGELPAVWIGGSFVTSKDEPGDIDVVYVLKRETVLVLEPLQLSVLEIIFEEKGHNLTGAVSPFFFYLEEMIDHTAALRNGDASNSLAARGYWDQLWSRTRDSSKPAYPVRGYLEVIIDDYQ